MKQFDVAVVGGGHAGVEAAHAAARMGARTALVTFRRADLGVMSCNPAIGGLGKGHLVREIDALDGVMARAADFAGIQYRLLNRSRGPAVQGPRVQADRARYQSFVLAKMESQPLITIIEGEVIDIVIESGRAAGLDLADGVRVLAGAVVLTTGTFLRGVIHVGREKTQAGRRGAAAAARLADRLRDLAPRTGRLKTGTPARLDGRTIDWASIGAQPGDERPTMMSFLNSSPVAAQISCGVTATTAATAEIIAANLQQSAMFGGDISGRGPRYCPSIEDKIVRFSDKPTHNVFLEPEGLSDHTVYPNGLSTSLPADIQDAFLRTIPGLEAVRIVQYGYAIEYDFVDPRCLGPGLDLLALPGLFLAGQINGTTGYEEAAAQGLVAGLNATLHVRGGDPVRFSRSDSYIGVMIDDLTTRGVTEPYRMFTSRAEFRLSLRVDNADQRLTPIGLSAGCVSDLRATAFANKMRRLGDLTSACELRTLTTQEEAALSLSPRKDGARRTVLDLLGQPEVEPDNLTNLVPELETALGSDIDSLRATALYAPYIQRQAAEAERLRRDDAVRLPDNLDYRSIPGLSSELSEKLTRIRPATLAAASGIEGMTPAALVLILAHARRRAGGGTQRRAV